MADKQTEFGDEFYTATMEWLDCWKEASGEMPRSDWIVYVLMSMAGHILSQAPDLAMKKQVMDKGLEYMGEALGFKVLHEHIDMKNRTIN